MPDPRIALIGNSFASKVQLPALSSVGGNVVVGIAGFDLEKAKQTAAKWGIEKATDNYRELLSLDPDLVIISTPVDLHHSMVVDALEHTRAAILCEKPFAMNVDEATELCARAEGRACFIDHQLRFSPFRQKLREMIGAGYLGDFLHADYRIELGSKRHFDQPYRWWFDSTRGGGALGALASHMIDMIRFELGEVEAVRCHLETCIATRRDAKGAERSVTADDHAKVDLRMKAGGIVHLSASVAVPHGGGFYARYTGTEGTLVLEDEERLSGAPLDGALEPVEVTVPEGGGPPKGGPFAQALPLFLRPLLDAVRSGATEVLGAATFSDGLATQRVLDAARKSAEGGWVSL